MKINLKGIPAIIAIVLFLGGSVGYRMFLHSDLPKDPKLRRELESNLQFEIAGDIMSDAKAIEQAIASGDKAKATQMAEGIMQRRVEIHDGTGEIVGEGDGLRDIGPKVRHGQGVGHRLIDRYRVESRVNNGER